MVILIFQLCLFLIIAFSISKYKIKPVKDLNSLNQLPGPINFPFIGGIFQILILGGRDHNYIAYHRACKKYGKIMGLRGGIQEYLITHDREAIKEILNSAQWTNRFPSSSLYHQHTFGSNFGLIFSNGDTWRDTRRFATRTLGEHGFGDLRTADQILTEEVDAFLTHLENKRTESNGLVAVNGLFAISSLNVSWALIAGNRFEYDDKELEILVHLVERAAECEFGLHPVFSFPCLGWIPGVSPLGKFQACFEAIYVQLEKLIEQRRNENKQGKNDNSNLVDSFLEKIEEEKLNSESVFTDKQLFVAVADLLVAAIDTTSNTLAFAMLYMVKYPRVQYRVQAELDQVLGERSPSVFDRPNLPYTEATMWEILRIANVLPVFIRTSTSNSSIGGYFVKEGTFGVLNVYQMHMDPSIWGDPCNFRPERFIDQDGKVIRDNGVLAFGGGRRVCIGQTVAMLSFLTFFASILQKYNVEADYSNPDPSLEPLTGFSNSPRPFAAQFSLRQ